MNLYERYVNGEYEKIYQVIDELGTEAFSSTYFPEVDKVLTETFQRVKFNVELIYSELKKIDYRFYEQNPLQKPLPNTSSLLKELEDILSEYGYIPLSLQYFYKIVGAVDFMWDFKHYKTFMWDMADPLQIFDLNYVFDCLTDEYWQEDIQDYIEDEEIGCAFIQLSADDYHKDNVSGGMSYSLQLTTTKSIDSLFLFEHNETTFIDYLRKSFEYCGFLGKPEDKSFQEFRERVRPKLKRI